MAIKWTTVIFILFLAFSPEAEAATARPEGLVRENQVLTAELTLAKKPGVYFIFDMVNKKIYCKYRGTVLKEMPVQGHSVWSGPSDIVTKPLMKKSALIKPGRKKIGPDKSGNNDTFEVEALELDDMPPQFSLVFADGTTIAVRQKPEGLLSGLSSLSRSAYWYITRPLCSTWSYLRGSPCTSLLMVMSREDAQALYWSISEGLECIIVFP